MRTIDEIKELCLKACAENIAVRFCFEALENNKAEETDCYKEIIYQLTQDIFAKESKIKELEQQAEAPSSVTKELIDSPLSFFLNQNHEDLKEEQVTDDTPQIDQIPIVSLQPAQKKKSKKKERGWRW